MKRLAKRPRREPLIASDVDSKSDDDVPLSQLHLRRPPAPEARDEGTLGGSSTAEPRDKVVEGTASASETNPTAPVHFDLAPGSEPALTSMPVTSETPVTSTAAAPGPTNALVVFTGADSTATPAGPSKTISPPTTPVSPFDRSKEYGVSVIRNSFLTILKESHIQVLERGGDFAGIKSVLEPLLDVMQSLTSATDTLPYRTHLVQAETLFNKWQRQRDQSLHPKIGDRAMELMRIRDDTQFELQREILEKKQTIDQLMERATTLYAEKKRVADAERNQQLRVDSLKTALADIQAKLAEAESELAAATEKHQSLIAQWTAHEAEVQAESDDLEGLSVAVSQTPVLSDDDLYKQATEEVKAAHKESMAKITTEIRQALEKL